jgi:hypothetical protein
VLWWERVKMGRERKHRRDVHRRAKDKKTRGIKKAGLLPQIIPQHSTKAKERGQRNRRGYEPSSSAARKMTITSTRSNNIGQTKRSAMWGQNRRT